MKHAFPKPVHQPASTTPPMRRRHRRLITRFDHAMAAMKQGRSLLLELNNSSAIWALSDGSTVTAEVASLVLNSASIEPAGDAMSPGMPARAWRFCREMEAAS